ncbi:hypothetical protein [Pseudokineococcus sp. 1T1Z-3]|uniref:hypothetical protein n=1 Tax=Pseudokineococcus sp. 1T1Z-3 TaxID=3132745 RepID=UPI00309A5728
MRFETGRVCRTSLTRARPRGARTCGVAGRGLWLGRRLGRVPASYDIEAAVTAAAVYDRSIGLVAEMEVVVMLSLRE